MILQKKMLISFVRLSALTTLLSLCTFAQEKIGNRLVKQGNWKNYQIEYVDRQIAVKIKVGIKTKDLLPLFTQHNATIVKNFDKLRWGLIEVPEVVDIFSVIKGIEQNPMIEVAEPNGVLRPSFDTNDPYYLDGHQWALKNWSQNPPAGTNDADIDAPEAWDITRGSSDIIIGVLDSGIPMLNDALSHPDLDDPNKIILGPDYIDQPGTTDYLEGVRDRLGHGTHVAGIVSAETNNSTGVAGVAGGCKLLVVQVFNSGGGGSMDALRSGTIYAVDYGVKVINFSGGWYAPSQALYDAIDYANSNNVVFVTTAGNNNLDSIKYPARYSSSFSNVIAVGAIDHNDSRSPYSNKGPDLVVTAPGGYGSAPTGYNYGPDDIYSTTPNYFFNLEYVTHGYITENYGYMAGTSMAAPHVAGILALILSVFPTLTPSQVRSIIVQSTDKVSGMGGQDFTNGYGYGRVNAYKALLKAITLYSQQKSGAIASNTTWSGYINVTGSVTVNSGVTLTISPGTVIIFQNGVSMTVNGTLNSQGSSSQPIIYASATGAIPGSWSGITVQGSASVFKWCTFQYGTIPLTIASTSTNPITVENCTFRYNSYCGLSVGAYGKAKVKSSNIHNNNGSGILCNTYGGTIDLIGNRIYNNTGGGINSYYSNVVQLYGNVIENNGGEGIFTAFSDIIRIGRVYTWWGYNTIRENGGDEVSNSQYYSTVELSGASVHDDAGWEIYNYPGNPTINAQSVYWNTDGPQVSGNVTYLLRN